MKRLLFRLMLFVATIFVPSAAVAQETSTPPTPSACIAIVLPSVHGVEGDATTVGSSIRELFASFLRGPSMQVVLLDARLTSHAVEEARQKECTRVLTITLTRKRGGGGGGMFGSVIGQAASSAAWGLPVGGVGGAVVRGAATATTQAISELASSTKARDEVRIDYRLTSLDGKTQLGPKTDKAKAKADGEDLLTPMVERAAEAIVGVAK
ncbi:MAG: hypothetical protein WBC51_18340 [Vicinamibacterales bacterium]